MKCRDEETRSALSSGGHPRARGDPGLSPSARPLLRDWASLTRMRDELAGKARGGAPCRGRPQSPPGMTPPRLPPDSPQDDGARVSIPLDAILL